MAKFRFKFESVLRVRRIAEDEAQRALAAHLRERMILAGELRGMQETIVSSRHDLADGLRGKVNLDDVAGFARYSLQVRARAQSIVLRLAGVEKNIDAARQRLLDATRKRKALELLEERHREAWTAEQARRETAKLDELAVQNYARKVMAGELT